MELREDEIEALLKLDGMTLEIHHDLRGAYTAIIYGVVADISEQRSFHAVRETRRAAVQGVWQDYQTFMGIPTRAKFSAQWLLADRGAMRERFYFEIIEGKQ